MAVTGGDTPWMVNPQMLSNFATPQETVRDFWAGEGLGLVTPLYAAGHAALTGETTLGYPVEGPVHDALEGLGPVADVAETFAGTFAPYSAARKAVKEGGITRGGIGPALAQFGGGSLAGGPVDIEAAREGAERDRRSELTAEERAREDLGKEIAKLGRLGLDADSERVISEALAVESQRDLAYSQIVKETKPGPRRERRKLQAVIDVLAQSGRLPQTEAKKLRAYLPLVPAHGRGHRKGSGLALAEVRGRGSGVVPGACALGA